jgi:D-alanyl-D-alanine carboxypeptidase (penicillin-binding protein 5/6)
VYVTLPRGAAVKIKPVVERNDPLVAPINQYAPVGTLKLMAGDKVINTLPLLALEQVNQATIIGRTYDSLRLLLPH